MSEHGYFFGCWGEPGHLFWASGRRGLRSAGFRPPPTVPWRQVDCKLTPPTHHLRHLDVDRREPQSVALLHHKAGWTALAMHDRTGDSRGASNSVFLFPRTLDFDEAVQAARDEFPAVVERIEAAAPITAATSREAA